ncbi:MAG: response regulator transcription factor [Deltaproteobacteria bacterium]
MKKILIVDDEKDIVELISYNLIKEGFSVVTAFDGNTAVEVALKDKPDLLILDLMLPGIDGLEVCRQLKQNPFTEKIPVIMLTAKIDTVDKIVGLELGADDYITKPFNVRELVARVRAIFRRLNNLVHSNEDVFSHKSLCLNYHTCELTVDGRVVEISATEYKLLSFLTKNQGRVFSRDAILDHIWRDETFVEPRTVDVHIGRLRAKIERDRKTPQYILTASGIGYKFSR